MGIVITFLGGNICEYLCKLEENFQLGILAKFLDGLFCEISDNNNNESWYIHCLLAV